MTKDELLLGKLLEERLTPGNDVSEIDRRIRAQFEEDWCVVYTNMRAGRDPSGSVITYLARVHEMKRMTRPIMEASGGTVLKVIADRFIVLFKRPHDALNGLLQVNRRLASYNEGRGADAPIAVGAGMGFGKLIKVGNDDVFGLEAVFASRLGSELAQPYEILVSDSARAALLHTPNVRFEDFDAQHGFAAFRVRYDLEHKDSRPPYRADLE